MDFSFSYFFILARIWQYTAAFLIYIVAMVNFLNFYHFVTKCIFVILIYYQTMNKIEHEHLSSSVHRVVGMSYRLDFMGNEFAGFSGFWCWQFNIPQNGKLRENVTRTWLEPEPRVKSHLQQQIPTQTDAHNSSLD